MEDLYRAAHFDVHAENLAPLSRIEKDRIHQTVAMVPEDWRQILDVGCGDGRVSGELLKRGVEILGIDWSKNSVAHFPGPTCVCDIRKPWPFEKQFDGAICCEVLEHFEPREAAKVVANMKSFTRHGFLVTVPAREAFKGNCVTCSKCGQHYHIWGHCRRFNSFQEVDAMIGLQSVERKLIVTDSLRCSERLTVWQRRLGFTPWSVSYLCPHCGEKLREPTKPAFLNRIANKGIAGLQRLGSPFRQARGWFACLYAQ